MIKPLDWICLSRAILANLSQLEKLVIISPIGFYLQAGWEPVLQLLLDLMQYFNYVQPKQENAKETSVYYILYCMQ